MNKKIAWTTVKAAVFDKTGTTIDRARIGSLSGSKYDDIDKANRILIYRLATIKEDKKTDTVDFRIASKAEQMTLPTVKTQKITLTAVDGVTLTAPTTTVNYYTIEVTGDDVAKSFEPGAILSNPSIETGVTPKITSVKEATDTSGTAKAPSGVRILANGRLKEDGSKIKITLSDDLKIDSVSFWRITAESATIYIKLIVTAPEPDADILEVNFSAGATGKTKITATASAGNSLKYAISDSEVTGVKVGDTVTGSSFTSGDEIAITDGKYITVYEVDANGKAVKFSSKLVSANQIGTGA